MGEIYMNFRFKDIREDLDLKQKEIAEIIGISRGAYANIECETANIKLKDLFIYSCKFNYSLDYICNLTNINNFNLKKIDKIDKSLISQRLSLIENELGLEAKDIANLLGIDKSTYSYYKNINKTRLIQTLMLKKICNEYGYSMDWIIGRSNIKTIKTDK